MKLKLSATPTESVGKTKTSVPPLCSSVSLWWIQAEKEATTEAQSSTEDAQRKTMRFSRQTQRGWSEFDVDVDVDVSDT